MPTGGKHFFNIKRQNVQNWMKPLMQKPLMCGYCICKYWGSQAGWKLKIGQKPGYVVGSTQNIKNIF